MSTTLLVTISVFALVGLTVWIAVAARTRRRAQQTALEQLGFVPCPEKKAWLEETIAGIENNKGYRYEVREPRQLRGEPAIYHYVKVRHDSSNDDPMVEEEILFPLKRASAGGLVLTVKPSAVAPGLATRLLGTLAAGPWDSQPDDLERIEVPLDLKNTNLLAALGPAGSTLYDHINSGALTVMQGLGDAGAMIVRARDSWCIVASTGRQVPFQVSDIIARIRPLLS